MGKIGFIGIDVGGTKTRLALFDRKFNVLADIKLKTQDSKDAKEFTQALNQPLADLIKKSEKASLEVETVGVGCAASFNRDGIVKHSPNIPFLERYSFRR